MDPETFKIVISVVAIVVTLVLGLPAGLKALIEIVQTRRARLRTEAEFAAKLAEQSQDPQLTDYAHQLGCAALVGDSRLTHEQRKCLLAHPNAVVLLQQFRMGQHLLDVQTEGATVVWRTPRLQKQGYRRLLRGVWISGYVLSCCLAASPIFAWALTHHAPEVSMPRDLYIALLVTLVYFFPVAIYCARQGYKLDCAERAITMTASGTF